MRPSHELDRVRVIFDDDHAVASAGLLLPATLAARLGIETLADETIDLGDRPGAARPGRKVMTLVHSIVAGGDSIDDADVLRCGSTAEVRGHRVMAPSTLGTFLRSFTFGHVRHRLSEVVLTGVARKNRVTSRQSLDGKRSITSWYCCWASASARRE